MITNYVLGSFLEKTHSTYLLIAGCTFNLFLLGVYKYTGFLLQSINDVLGTTILVPEIVLPLGISFFTFTQIAYLVDAYRGETHGYNLLTYSLFVTVFPHLIAGPILYHKHMIPQFSRLRNFIFSHQNMATGISMFSIGLFKKVMIADTLAPWVKVVFENADKVTFVEAWAGALGYTLQLYFDFSGYSEMAVGLGLMLNFSLPINFNSPYKATSIIDFWRRWHISLSAFLKNYLYIPLGGNRRGEWGRMRNLLLTMLLGGLWHGAGWTYVIWGGLHGLFLVVNHGWRKLNISLPRQVAWTLTFLCVIIAWVFFRANTVSDAVLIVQAMMDYSQVDFPISWENRFAFLKTWGIAFRPLPALIGGSREIVILVLLTVVVKWAPNTMEIVQKQRYNWIWAIAISIILFLSLINMSRTSDFLYFQF
jgi:alginate O-acetyltransferase complex protein AlgI